MIRSARFVALIVFAAAMVAPASAQAAFSNTSAPTIFGTAQQGHTLGEQNGTYSDGFVTVIPGSFALQWQRCNAGGVPSTCVNIPGATGQAYTLTGFDVGSTIRVLETAFTGAGQTGTSSGPTASLATAVISAAESQYLPAITATTQAADNITTTSAKLHGLINTGGNAVTWQFQWGTNGFYNKATSAQTLAGSSGTASVSWTITKLSANTIYHYRLVLLYHRSGEITYVYGRDLTLLTKSTGALLLLSRRLTVTGKFVSIPLKCSSKLKCVSRITITTSAKIKGKTGPLICTSKLTSLKPGQSKTFKGKLTSACFALLKAARKKHHGLLSKLTTRPRTGQKGIIKQVTLV
jgi:hypothetical protein